MKRMEFHGVQESYVENTISYYPPTQTSRERGDFSPLEPEVPTMAKSGDTKDQVFDFKTPDTPTAVKEEDEEDVKISLLGQSALINTKGMNHSMGQFDSKMDSSFYQADSFAIFHPITLGNEEIDDLKDLPLDYFEDNLVLNGNFVSVKEGDPKK